MVSVGLCWARVGTILGLSWAILGYVGTFWATLAPYWAHVGPFCAIFGSVSAFVLDLGISSMQGVCTKHPKYQEKIQFVDCVADGFCCYFFVFVSFLGHAAVRLCLPDLGLMLGHFVVFCGLRLPLLSHFRCILWFVGKSWDQIRLILGHVGTFSATWAPYWVMLSHFSCILWFLLAFVGQELGPYWAYLGPFWAMLGHFGQRWHRIGLC